MLDPVAIENNPKGVFLTKESVALRGETNSTVTVTCKCYTSCRVNRLSNAHFPRVI